MTVAVTVAVGCADRPVAPYPSSPPPPLDVSKFGPGDVVDIRVYGEQDLSGSYRVGPDGTIRFPLINRFSVQGRTPTEVENALEKALADGYLNQPQVSVFPKESAKKVTVMGQVQSPGTFAYTGNMSIIEAITQAGGFTPMAKKNSVRVTRLGKPQLFVAVEDIGLGKSPNFYLRPGDVIYVDERLF